MRRNRRGSHISAGSKALTFRMMDFSSSGFGYRSDAQFYTTTTGSTLGDSQRQLHCSTLSTALTTNSQAESTRSFQRSGKNQTGSGNCWGSARSIQDYFDNGHEDDAMVQLGLDDTRSVTSRCSDTEHNHHSSSSSSMVLEGAAGAGMVMSKVQRQKRNETRTKALLGQVDQHNEIRQIFHGHHLTTAG